MKSNKVKLFAKALAEVVIKKHSAVEAKKIVENFLKLLEKSGMEKKGKEIIEMAEEMVLIKRGNKKIVFQTARKITPSQKKVLDKLTDDGDIVKEKINEELIAGVKIIINDSKQFDNSLQSKLQKIL